MVHIHLNIITKIKKLILVQLSCINRTKRNVVWIWVLGLSYHVAIKKLR